MKLMLAKHARCGSTIAWLAALACAIIAPSQQSCLAAIGFWAQLLPEGAGPSPRYYATMVFDPVQNQAILFGGTDLGSFNDVWILTPGGTGGPRWRLVQTSGTPPLAREGHAAIWDPVRRRMIVSGGHSLVYESPAGVWAYSVDDSTWHTILPSGTPLPARAYHVAIYDPEHDWMVVQGGKSPPDFRSPLKDAWALDLRTLSGRKLSFSGVSTSLLPASHHACIHDPAGHRLVMFGGYLGQDTWQSPVGDTLHWTRMDSVGRAPASSNGIGAAYDPLRARIVTFGGGMPASGPVTDSSWTLDLAPGGVWCGLAAGPPLPTPRWLHSMVWDSVSGRVLMCCGVTSAWAPFSDTWALSFGEPTGISVGGLTASTGSGFVRLEWSAYLEGSPDFRVMRGVGADGPYELVRGEPAARGGNSDYVFVDRTVQPGALYFYKVGYRADGRWEYSGPVRIVTPAAAFSLGRARPNPMFGSTELAYEFVRSGEGDLSIYDLVGQRVRTLLSGSTPAGRGIATWDGRDQAGRRLPAGIYFARLTFGLAAQGQRILLMR
ncbi:MAG: hypothetical protein HZB25_08160 [Candidatus Eisenbacteria bacterium]|nr:hypothetical protein [Candidatus Eisenbacteria bacterium]